MSTVEGIPVSILPTDSHVSQEIPKGEIKRYGLNGIYIAERSGLPMRTKPIVRVVQGKGIEGDRYFGNQLSDGAVTIITQTGIDLAAIELNDLGIEPITAVQTRRNFVVADMDPDKLNALVNEDPDNPILFSIGGIMFRATDLADPCNRLSQLTRNFKGKATNEDKAVIEAFNGRGGIRAVPWMSGPVTASSQFWVYPY